MPRRARSAPQRPKCSTARGIEQLYSHQAEAFDHVAAGRNVVIVTPTASGKTLCYNLPVLNRAARATPAPAPCTCSPPRRSPRISSTNSTPSSKRWAPTSAPSPTMAIPRRTPARPSASAPTSSSPIPTCCTPASCPTTPSGRSSSKTCATSSSTSCTTTAASTAAISPTCCAACARICEFYGSQAAVHLLLRHHRQSRANSPKPSPDQPFELVDRNGAPAGEKFFVFYNPPVVNRQLGIRRSYINETRRIAHGVHRARPADPGLRQQPPRHRNPGHLSQGRLRPRPHPHRNRARLSRRLSSRASAARSNSACATATSAPSSPPTRSNSASTSARSTPSSWPAIPAPSPPPGSAPAAPAAARPPPPPCWSPPARPLDQYIVEHPEYFFDRSPEHAHINPDNLEILLSHLKCAAFELPIARGRKVRPARHRRAVHASSQRIRLPAPLRRQPGIGPRDTYPADAVSLRAVTSDNFVVIDITGEPKVIAEVSFPAALTTLHEKAIYLHEARQYPRRALRLRRAQSLRQARRLRLLHRRHRLHPGQELDANSKAQPLGGSRARARRRPRQPPDRRLQEDQVLHHRKRGRGQAPDAGAGNAHHRLLAALPRGVPGPLPAITRPPKNRTASSVWATPCAPWPRCC